MSLYQALSLTFNLTYAAVLITLLVLTARPLIKGAPFVPTSMKRIRLALKMAKVKPGEKVYDLGCGDGRLVMEAVKVYGAEGIGIEYSPLVYWLACFRRYLSGIKTKLIYGSYRNFKLKDADVVFCFLMPERLPELKEKFSQELKAGSRVITYAWPIPGWKISKVARPIKGKNLFRLFLYELPAKKSSKLKSTKHFS